MNAKWQIKKHESYLRSNVSMLRFLVFAAAVLWCGLGTGDRDEALHTGVVMPWLEAGKADGSSVCELPNNLA